MTTDRVAAELIASSQALHESLAGVSEEVAAAKPEPQGWSVLDCMEHLALAERGLLRRIVEAEPAEPLPVDPSRESRATSAVVNRSVRTQAPERAHPAGRFADLAHALSQFDAARAETIRFAEAHGEQLTQRTAVHPFFGTLTGEELLLVMAGHVRRHVSQIEETILRVRR